MDKILSGQDAQALIASGVPIVEVLGVTRKSKFASFKALKAASKDKQGHQDLFEQPGQVTDQDLMVDATELTNEAKAVVVDYLIKASN